MRFYFYPYFYSNQWAYHYKFSCWYGSWINFICFIFSYLLSSFIFQYFWISIKYHQILNAKIGDFQFCLFSFVWFVLRSPLFIQIGFCSNILWSDKTTNCDQSLENLPFSFSLLYLHFNWGFYFILAFKSLWTV